MYRIYFSLHLKDDLSSLGSSPVHDQISDALLEAPSPITITIIGVLAMSITAMEPSFSLFLTPSRNAFRACKCQECCICQVQLIFGEFDANIFGTVGEGKHW